LLDSLLQEIAFPSLVMLSLRNLLKWNKRTKCLHKDFLNLCVASRKYCDVKEPSDPANGNANLTSTQEDSKDVEVKRYPNFESRLEHYRKLGIKVEPKLINISDEPKTNIVLDTAIELMQGKPPSELAPREIYTENADHRSITTFPPDHRTLIQKWHEEEPEETTLGFPVVRPPHPLERWREGIRITKSSRADYPYIQDFNHHYDIVIVGGGLVGSFIANYLTERVEVKKGPKVAVIEKDPSYKNSVTTTSALGLRMQHSLPETVEMSLYGSDIIRNIARKMSIPFDEISDDDYFNIPNVKFQPHGHLTLANEDQMEDLTRSHEIQKIAGVQSALLTPKMIKLRFPWINTQDIAGACLGLESEGWFDSWNLLQAVKLKNIHQGVDYIDGEVIYFKKHSVPNRMAGHGLVMGRYEDGSPVPMGTNFEAHVLLPGSQQVYPIHFSTCMLAGGGATQDLGKMAGIGDGVGVLGVEIPVERKRGYVFNVSCQTGPGLNCPLTTDPTGLFLRREGHMGNYLVGKVPDGKDIPVNMHGDVDPDYWDQEILPTLRHRVDRFDDLTLMGSHSVDYDYNYFDGSPIIGPHPYFANMWMACGFNGLGPQMAPAVGRALTELFYDNGYGTIDLSRFSFDRVMKGLEVRENSSQLFRQN